MRSSKKKKKKKKKKPRFRRTTGFILLSCCLAALIPSGCPATCLSRSSYGPGSRRSKPDDGRVRIPVTRRERSRRRPGLDAFACQLGRPRPRTSRPARAAQPFRRRSRHADLSSLAGCRAALPPSATQPACSRLDGAITARAAFPLEALGGTSRARRPIVTVRTDARMRLQVRNVLLWRSRSHTHTARRFNHSPSPGLLRDGRAHRHLMVMASPTYLGRAATTTTSGRWSEFRSSVSSRADGGLPARSGPRLAAASARLAAARHSNSAKPPPRLECRWTYELPPSCQPVPRLPASVTPRPDGAEYPCRVAASRPVLSWSPRPRSPCIRPVGTLVTLALRAGQLIELELLRDAPDQDHGRSC